MARKEDIEALLRRSETAIGKIAKEYEGSLHNKEISADLRIDIKEIYGNLRSVLDYLAHDIVDKYCPGAKPKNILYFPIRGDQNSFVADMNKSYPDLIVNNPKIYGILNDLQPFIKDENKWLSFFNKLNNENKHNNLVAQTRTEVKEVKVSGGGGSVSWGSGVTFGSGVSVMGVPIDPNTQLPIPNNTVKTEIITWVDFQFDDINMSALGLTRESLKRISEIYSSLKDELY